jgi:hypothetical protein
MPTRHGLGGRWSSAIAASASVSVSVHQPALRTQGNVGPGCGVVVRYVLELEWASGERTLIEQTVPESEAFNLAAFEAFIQDLMPP